VFEPGGLVRRRQNLQLGFTDEMSMRQAKARKQQLLATINAGKFIIQSQVPFREVVQRFLDVHVPTLGSAAREQYPIQIRNHIVPAFGDLRLCDVTQAMVQTWLNGKASDREETIKQEDGSEVTKTVPALSWWTRWDLRGILSGIFNRAKEWKLWDGENPCRGVSLGKKRVKRAKRIPTAEDLQRFLQAIPENSLIDQIGAQLIVVTAAVSGLRVSEVLGLSAHDIDSQGQTLRVERRWRRGDEDDPKSEASKRVRQMGSLADELLAYAEGRGAHEYIFLRKDGRPLDDRDLQRDVFRPAAEAVGIYHEGFGMHVFRRLNVTWRQQAGATPIEAQKAAGHASLDMTMLYTQTEDERERQHVDTMLGRLGRKKLETLKPEGGVQ
jgi:integrase